MSFNIVWGTAVMKKQLICSWCQPPSVMREGALPASHGICPTCSQALLAEVVPVSAVERAIEETQRHR